MDLLIVETGNGGDLVKITKDVKVINGFQGMPYLAMFGGNFEESTPDLRSSGKQYFDWWGNDLLFPKDSSVQMNSETERALSQNPLTSYGRVKIEQAVKKDLEFLSDIADVSVTVAIPSDDRLIIAVKIDQSAFALIWDATKRELLQGEAYVDGNVIYINTFDMTFDFTLN